MGYALTPQFYKACECAFHSNNPIFPGEILLDMYYVTIQDKDKNGEVVGEREIPCVTHESLMRYYRETLMLRRTVATTDPVFSDPMVVKCTITKQLTPTDLKNLCKFYPDSSPDDFGTEIHVEAIGEASLQNAKSDIAQKYLANTAENRAFDRAMIKLLSLDTKEQIYGSSEEIGDQGEDVKQVPQQKDWLDKAKATLESKGPVSCEQLQMPIQECASVPAEKPAETPAPASTNPTPSPALAKSTPDANPNCKPIGSYDSHNQIHSMIGAINRSSRLEGYEELSMADDNDKSSVFNGKNIRQLVASMKAGDRDATEKLYQIVADPPSVDTEGTYYIKLVQYLIDNGCLRFVDGKLVVKGGF